MILGAGLSITSGLTVTGGTGSAPEVWTEYALSAPLATASIERLWYNTFSNVITGFGYDTNTLQAINLYSTDNGATWTLASNVGGLVNDFRDVAYDASTGNLVAVTGVNFGDFATARSSDGLTWVAGGSLPNTQYWYGAGGGGGTFLAGAFSNTILAYSTNAGVSWLNRNVNYGGGSDCLTYGNGVWLNTYRNTIGNAYRSTDNGVTWTATSTTFNPYGSKYVNNVFWVNTLTQGTNSLKFSTDDAVSWQTCTLPVSAYWNVNSLSYVNGYWFIIGNVGTTYYYAKSTDKINWTSITPPSSLNMASLATTANGVIVLADPVTKGYAGTLVLN